MPIDVVTLYQLNFTIGLTMAGICFFSWIHQRDILGLRGWSAALLLGSLGSLELSLRTNSSPLLLVIMANSLVVAGYASVWMSVRRFNSGERGVRHTVVPTAVFVVIFSVALLAGTDVNVRVAICSLTIAILSLLAGREAFRGRMGEQLKSRIPTALALLLMACAMVVRAIFSLVEDPPVGDTTPFYDPTQGITLLVNTICVVAMTLGFLMMANERLRQHYEKLASTDQLTNLPNRRFLLAQGARPGGRACVLMIDLDHFSEVNRTFGHAGGDQALIAFARLARQQLRPTDLIARYGGEEFCALLHDTVQAEALQVAERLRAAVADLSIDIGGGQVLRITTSIGVAQLDGDLGAAMHRADVALYRAKALGRNQVRSADDETASAAR
ncbi:GGDEF domain-containing protein [Reyranella sp.]|uniref:GGDEF domain-containing protein n=1 Tax=Reyranella sp. TaxID=1929291 RepID=UPI003BAA793D